MDTMRICKQCGQPLPENAPEGLCPTCLAKVALGTQPAAPGATINVNPLAEAAPGTRVPPKPCDLAPQFPQLEILELLGVGGMGMVYKARQPRLDRLVALKILPIASMPEASFADRFEREAKALAKLNHPGIVTLHDFGQTKEYYYFIMEFVAGMNLRQLIQAKTLAPRQALELVTQICAALQFAHDENIVHRDIKPENILLTKKGQVKIADFGLAKLLGGQPDTSLTASQMVMGTLNYMAPEQRENTKAVDHRADIYSLGVVFYEMLTGEVPMGRFEPPSKKVQVDVRLDEVVLHALEREPARRYQHVSEVKTHVETIARTTPAAAQTASTPASAAPKLLPASSTAWIAFLVVEMVLTLGLGAFLLQIVPALGVVWIVAVFLVASFQLNCRKEINDAREGGLWPQPGELPTLEHVKLLARARKRHLAIKLYRELRGVSRANARAAVELLVTREADPSPATAPPPVAANPDLFWRRLVVVVLVLIAILILLSVLAVFAYLMPR